MTQTVCLSMIVRNEAHNMPRCLASIRGLITHYAIVDTGSTDGTQDVIRRELAGIPGSVIDRHWVDFATNRQQALELAQASGADFILTLDADEELVWPAGKPIPELKEDLYGIRFRMDGGEQTWTRSFIFRSALPWQWVGARHESLECPGVEPERTLIMGAYVHSHDDGARGKRKARKHSIFDYLGVEKPPPAKYQKDIEVLERDVAADPKNTRAVFYLAQSYACNRQYQKAVDTYLKRAAMGGWIEEVFYALYQVAALRGLMGRPFPEIAQSYLDAWQARPERAEPLWALAALYNERKQPAIGAMYARAACGIKRPDDCLMVTESVYEWRSAETLAASLVLMGQYDEARTIIRRVLAVKSLEGEERTRCEENLSYLDEKIAEVAAA